MADEGGWRPSGGGVCSRPGRGQAAPAFGLGRQAGAALEGILNGVWVEACGEAALDSAWRETVGGRAGPGGGRYLWRPPSCLVVWLGAHRVGVRQ